MPSDGINEPIYTVSKAIAQAKRVIRSNLPPLWISGEISAVPYMGNHWYFAIKDKSAELKCACFATENQRIRFRPEIGMQINARGAFDIYSQRGEFQFIVEHMEIAGEGALRAQYERLKRDLEQEGLFHERHKQLLPEFPKRIAVITSTSGAAIGDVVKQLRKRYVLAEVVVINSLMQGHDAPKAIVAAIQKARQPMVNADVVLLTRGGGSFEDLNAFNDEGLARAVFACHLPTVCAIGHERDTTIAELVADYRAATPTAAVVAMTPDQFALRTEVGNLVRRAYEQLQSALTARIQSLSRLNALLRKPSERIDVLRFALNSEHTRLIQAINQSLAKHTDSIAALDQRLVQNSPVNQLNLMRQHHEALDRRLQLANPASKVKDFMARAQTAKKKLVDFLSADVARRAAHLRVQLNRIRQQNPATQIAAFQQQTNRLRDSLTQRIQTNLGSQRSLLQTQTATLRAVSPLATLERGYAVVTKPDGTTWGDIIANTDQVVHGETIHAHIQGGTIESTVVTTSKRDDGEATDSAS